MKCLEGYVEFESLENAIQTAKRLEGFDATLLANGEKIYVKYKGEITL